MFRYRTISDIPKEIVNAALDEYQFSKKDVKLICMKYGFSTTTLYRLRNEAGIPDRPKHRLFNIRLH